MPSGGLTLDFSILGPLEAADEGVYSRFTEGFETHDLVVARALLDELGFRTVAQSH